MFIYLSITKYASHLDLDPYKIMSSKQMSRSMSKSTFTYLFMILESIIKGNMIISTSMNINLGHLGGASIFAKIHLWRHFIEMFFFQLLWRGILISLNLYLFLVIHNNFTMSCYPNSALSSVMIPLSPNSFGCLWIEKLLLVLCLNTPSYYSMVS